MTSTIDRKNAIKMIKSKINVTNFSSILNDFFCSLFEYKIIVKHIGDNSLNITFSNNDAYNQYGKDLLKILSTVFPNIQTYRFLQSIGHHAVICYYIF